MKKKYIIETYSIGDYLLISRLINGDTISWYEAKEKLLSSRAAYADHIRTASRLTSGHSAEVDSYTLPIYIRTI